MHLGRILAISGIILFTIQARAQQCSGDFTLFAGHGRIPGVVLVDGIFSGGGSEVHSIASSSGCSFAGARYFLANEISVGLCYNYFYYTYNDITQYSRRSTGFTYHTLTGGVTGIWHNAKSLRVYSFLDAGMQFQKSSRLPDVDRAFAMQAGIIGLSFGHRLSGSLEFGIGYKGLINGGISYSISRKPALSPIADKNAGD